VSELSDSYQGMTSVVPQKPEKSIRLQPLENKFLMFLLHLSSAI
jgi:hypothetical protein